jgi:hypothetical protein
MKIQYKLKLLSQVSIISLFTDNARDVTNLRHIVRHQLSRDGIPLYEKSLMVTNLDISYLNSLIFANTKLDADLSKIWTEQSLYICLCGFQALFLMISSLFLPKKKKK